MFELIAGKEQVLNVFRSRVIWLPSSKIKRKLSVYYKQIEPDELSPTEGTEIKILPPNLMLLRLQQYLHK